jgi:hypothetical protein
MTVFVLAVMLPPWNTLDNKKPAVPEGVGGSMDAAGLPDTCWWSPRLESDIY